MNIQRLKNFVIVALLLLNIVLLGLNYEQSNKYRLTDDKESNIKTLLSNNRIYLYEALTRDFSPKYRLNLLPFTYDENALCELFFGNTDIKKTVEPNRVTYRHNNATLTFTGGFAVYDDPEPSDGANTNATRQQRCEELLTSFEEMTSSAEFERDQSFTDEEYQIIEYRSRYDGMTIYSNYIRFAFTEGGLSQVRFQYAEPLSYTGEKKEIYSADEALLTLMYEIKNIYGDTPAFVREMELVYTAETTGSADQTTASPYYRIYIKEQNEPFLINAFFNQVRY